MATAALLVPALAAVLAAAAASAHDPAPAVRLVQAEPPRIRDVTPPGFTPAPAGEGPLVRIPGHEPAPLTPRWHRFFHPGLPAIGRIEGGGRAFDLAGIAPLPPEATCSDPDGGTWPCGRVALSQFRLMVRGRAIECFFAGDVPDDPLTTPCRIGRFDLSHWLASQGWAMPSADADAALRAAAEAARCAGRGLWRGASRAGCPERPAAAD